MRTVYGFAALLAAAIVTSTPVTRTNGSRSRSDSAHFAVNLSHQIERRSLIEASHGSSARHQESYLVGYASSNNEDECDEDELEECNDSGDADEDEENADEEYSSADSSASIEQNESSTVLDSTTNTAPAGVESLSTLASPTEVTAAPSFTVPTGYGAPIAGDQPAMATTTSAGLSSLEFLSGTINAGVGEISSAPTEYPGTAAPSLSPAPDVPFNASSSNETALDESQATSTVPYGASSTFDLPATDLAFGPIRIPTSDSESPTITPAPSVSEGNTTAVGEDIETVFVSPSPLPSAAFSTAVGGLSSGGSSSTPMYPNITVPSSFQNSTIGDDSERNNSSSTASSSDDNSLGSPTHNGTLVSGTRNSTLSDNSTATDGGLNRTAQGGHNGNGRARHGSLTSYRSSSRILTYARTGIYTRSLRSARSDGQLLAKIKKLRNTMPA